MKSKIIWSLSFVLVLTFTAFCFADKKEEQAKVKQPTLIAAYGTSYSPESSNAVALLDPASKGYWQPQSQDFGVNEGVYFQFLEPVHINLIKVIVEGNVIDKLYLQPYLDGQTQTRKSQTTQRQYLDIFQGEDGGFYYRKDGSRLDVFTAEGVFFYSDGKGANIVWDADGNFQEVIEGSPELYNITTAASVDRDGNTVFRITENDIDYLNYTAKSVFFKIKDAKILPRIKSIKIYGDDLNIPLAVNIPLAPKAVVTASSVLNPVIAYSPENLFDSQLDMAWSTNGKETDGLGQSVTVTFDNKEEIGGIIIWNGYQRSDAHYKANGRVKKLDINGQIVDVADNQGLQTILLPNNIKTDKITLTIKEIFKSKKYKDILISELRFITPEGQIILPQVKRSAAELSKNDIVKTDITYINLISHVVGESESDNTFFPNVSKDTLRIRSNGSFVLYREGDNESAGISEGNWQELGNNKIRIFGKKYRIIPSLTEIYSYSGYSSVVDDPDVKPTEVIIFQSDIVFAKFNSLAKKEQVNTLNFIFKNIIGEEDTWFWRVFIRAGTLEQFSTSKYLNNYDNMDSDEWRRKYEISKAVMFEDLLTEFEKINPICIKSDVYTGLMIPYDEAK